MQSNIEYIYMMEKPNTKYETCVSVFSFEPALITPKTTKAIAYKLRLAT